jgi:uncharacterized protein (TIGR02145 family)
MKISYKILLIAVLLITAPGLMIAQGVGINDDGWGPHPSSILHVKSTTKGMLIPRLTTAQIGAIANPSDGLQVYNTDNGNIYIFISTANVWKALSYGSGTINQLVCGVPIVDTRDGKRYTTILIGAQCWMSQNLNIGMMINGIDNQENNNIIEKYCYDNLESNCDIYGGLYQWNEAMQYSITQGVRGICPTGWHLPTDAEWTTLTDFVKNQSLNQCNSNRQYIAKAMAAKILWNASSNNCAIGNDLSLNNVTGFSALPGGYRSGLFHDIGLYEHWTNSSEYDTYHVWNRIMDYNSPLVFYSMDNKANGYSVRCVRD